MSSSENTHVCIICTLRCSHKGGMMRANCKRRRKCICALAVSAAPDCDKVRPKPIAVTTSSKGLRERACIRTSPTHTTGTPLCTSSQRSCCCHQSSSAAWCRAAPSQRRWVSGNTFFQSNNRASTACIAASPSSKGKRGGTSINTQSSNCGATADQMGR